MQQDKTNAANAANAMDAMQVISRWTQKSNTQICHLRHSATCIHASMPRVKGPRQMIHDPWAREPSEEERAKGMDLNGKYRAALIR